MKIKLQNWKYIFQILVFFNPKRYYKFNFFHIF
jgi:hypothetical protein